MIRLGVIGLGKMGLSHLAIANALDEFTVTAVSDLNRLVGKSISRYSGARYFRDYRQVLRDPEVEAVLVSVPSHLHEPIAHAALDARKHIFLEKPLSLSGIASQRLSDRARQLGLAAQVGYVNRLNPIFEHVRTLVEECAYGTPAEYASFMRGNAVGEEGAQGWRNTHAKGGGCLFEYGSHCIDLSLFLFGQSEAVRGITLERVVSSEVEDRVGVELVHRSGIRGRLSIDWCDPSCRKATNSVAIRTDGALLLADKQEIRIYESSASDLDEAMGQAASRAADTTVHVTDLDTAVPYYLRGEDFTRQLVEFHELVLGRSTRRVARFEDGAETDRLISEIIAAGRV